MQKPLHLFLLLVRSYVGFKVQRKIRCDMCKVELVRDKTPVRHKQCELVIHSGNRPCWPIRPTYFLLEVVTQVFVVIQALISKDVETKFLAVNNQKSLLCSLSIERLIKCGSVVGECSSGVHMTDLAKMCLSCIVNICLNN
jgi:hypothetical protein